MSDKPTCFMIQPFCEPYNQRYKDVYKPAIEAAGLAADRVDEDLAVKYIVDAIHKKIAKAAVCLAEISTDKPNIWYEIGYATASGVPVVYVCEKSRETKMPFDFADRPRIPYTTDSKSDFDTLQKDIIERLNANKKANKPSSVSTKQHNGNEQIENSSNRRDNYIMSLIKNLNRFDIIILKFILDYYLEHHTAVSMERLLEVAQTISGSAYNNYFGNSINKLMEKNLITISRQYTAPITYEYHPSGTAIELNTIYPEWCK